MGDRAVPDDNNLDLSVPLGYREFTALNSLIEDEPSLCEWSGDEEIYDLHLPALEKMRYAAAPFAQSDYNDRYRILERKLLKEMDRCGIQGDASSSAALFREYLIGKKGYSFSEALSVDDVPEQMLSEMEQWLFALTGIHRDRDGAAFFGEIVGETLQAMCSFTFRGPQLTRPEDVKWTLKEFLGFFQMATDISSDYVPNFTSLRLNAREEDCVIKEAFEDAAGGSEKLADSLHTVFMVAQGFGFMFENYNKRCGAPAQRAMAVRQYMDMYNAILVEPLGKYATGRIFEEIQGLKNCLDVINGYGVNSGYVDAYGLKHINALDRLGRDYLRGEIEFPEELESERLRLKKDGRENLQDGSNRLLMTVVARIFNDSIEKYRKQLEFLWTMDDWYRSKDRTRMVVLVFSNQFHQLYQEQQAQALREMGTTMYDLLAIDGRPVKEIFASSSQSFDEKTGEVVMKAMVLRAMLSDDRNVSIGIYGQTPEGYELVHIPYKKRTAYLGSQVFSTVGKDTLSKAQDSVVACLNAVEQRSIDTKQIPGVQLASYHMIQDIFGHDLIRALDRQGQSPFEYITVNTQPFMEVAEEFTIDGEPVEETLSELGMVLTVLRVDPNNEIVVHLPGFVDGEIVTEGSIPILVELNPLDIQMNLLSGAKNTMEQAISRYRMDLYDQLLALQSKKHAIHGDSEEFTVLRDRTIEMVQLASKVIYKGRYDAADMQPLREQLVLVQEAAKGYIGKKMEQGSGRGLPGSLRRVRLDASENIEALKLPSQVMRAASYEELAGDLAVQFSDVDQEMRDRRISRAKKLKNNRKMSVLGVQM
ncbi:hypothetical protein SAMN05216391_11615 [Lachnospiraceae bacterium KHCPX20]|nr:hypothetical protein SAMN05216391_11615 [Lachnospiraceae bacterium KHCPX20]